MMRELARLLGRLEQIIRLFARRCQARLMPRDLPVRSDGIGAAGGGYEKLELAPGFAPGPDVSARSSSWCPLARGLVAGTGPV
jgi:hypothetical protein